MKQTTLSLKEAKKLMLQRQGLSTGSAPFSSLMEVFHRLNYVQIDTISVVERAHHHVLWSRWRDYQKEDLARLVSTEKQVFEYWFHAAAFRPMRDYPLSLFEKAERKKKDKHWYVKNPDMMRKVMEEIRTRGPLQSKDFQVKTPVSKEGWGYWKPAKQALEHLFLDGELMVAHRKKFQKVYDLPERVLPENVFQSPPTRSEYIRKRIHQCILAYGIVKAKEVAYLRKGVKKEVESTLQEGLLTGEWVQVFVEGMKEPFFSTNAVLSTLETEKENSGLHILSPFDNVVIQRDRLKMFFDFDYKIECYVPEAKRQYGYFCLPVLWKGQFIARLDAKNDRKTKNLRLKSLFFEPEFEDFTEFLSDFIPQLQAFMHFQHCECVTLDYVNAPKFKSEFKKEMRKWLC